MPIDLDIYKSLTFCDVNSNSFIFVLAPSSTSIMPRVTENVNLTDVILPQPAKTIPGDDNGLSSLRPGGNLESEPANGDLQYLDKSSHLQMVGPLLGDCLPLPLCSNHCYGVTTCLSSGWIY
jgi:hypothetical protein